MTNGTSTAAGPAAAKLKTGDLRIERMRGMLEDLRREVAFRAALTQEKVPWRAAAEACVAAADAALLGGRREEVARLCMQGYRMLIHGFSPEEIEDRAEVLREEADEKLGGWRKQAVRDLLGTREAVKPVTAPRLALAQYVVDQHFTNVYFKLAVSAKRYVWTGYLLAVLAALAFGAAWVLDQPNPSGSPDLLHSVSRTGLVLLLGALGASLSYTLTVLGPSGKIPTLLSTQESLFVRPLLGAVSAVAVVVVLESGLLPVNEPTDLLGYAYAVAAGFTDQLLTRVMKVIEDSAQH